MTVPVTISLIIATHNRAALLRRCLESIAATRRPEGLAVTIVIADNNSTDETREVAESFIPQGSMQAVYLFVARPGKSAALNDAISQTDSDLVGTIDDDEQLDPAWFEVVAREFNCDQSLDFIGGQVYGNWERPAPKWLSKSYRGAIGIVENPTRMPMDDRFPGILMGGNAVIRRSVLNRVLPYPENIGKIGEKIRSGEDEVIYHRLLEIGARGLNVPDLVIYHWIPAERLTRSYFRRWVIGRGISVGWQLGERGFKEASLFGVPRYQIGQAIRALPKLIARSPADRFAAQLTILDCVAMLYGRHFEDA